MNVEEVIRSESIASAFVDTFYANLVTNSQRVSPMYGVDSLFSYGEVSLAEGRTSPQLLGGVAIQARFQKLADDVKGAKVKLLMVDSQATIGDSVMVSVFGVFIQPTKWQHFYHTVILAPSSDAKGNTTFYIRNDNLRMLPSESLVEGESSPVANGVPTPVEAPATLAPVQAPFTAAPIAPAPPAPPAPSPMKAWADMEPESPTLGVSDAPQNVPMDLVDDAPKGNAWAKPLVTPPVSPPQSPEKLQPEPEPEPVVEQTIVEAEVAPEPEEEAPAKPANAWAKKLPGVKEAPAVAPAPREEAPQPKAAEKAEKKERKPKAEKKAVEAPAKPEPVAKPAPQNPWKKVEAPVSSTNISEIMAKEEAERRVQDDKKRAEQAKKLEEATEQARQQEQAEKAAASKPAQAAVTVSSKPVTAAKSFADMLKEKAAGGAGPAPASRVVAGRSSAEPEEDQENVAPAVPTKTLVLRGFTKKAGENAIRGVLGQTDSITRVRNFTEKGFAFVDITEQKTYNDLLKKASVTIAGTKITIEADAVRKAK